nr:NACHT domain-containing protein [Kibdelosporangium sp. MJ126-NF4]CEL16844.1 putative large ATP-binding protein [Kibdelosporangium sp. MJ126-NF4]CTQ91928.1 putative large ATP-binding protein [Kibdelosporangium sp. MJ126-NF4]
MLETVALAVGRQVATHATRTWLGHRTKSLERQSSLADLLATGVTDQFARRKLARQLEDIGDQVAQRITPLAGEFPGLPDNEKAAALEAVVSSLSSLDDSLLFGVDLDGVRLARAVRQPVRDLNESAQALYNRVLDETCVCLVSVVKHLPAFTPRALTEVLSRLTHIETVLEQLPRTALDSPGEFTSRYLSFVASTLDSLELFGVDTRRYKPQVSVTVAYLSLSVTSGEENLRVEHALKDSSRTLVRGPAGSGKTTLLQWIAVNAARHSLPETLARWNNKVPFLIRLRRYPDGDLPQPQDMVAANAAPIAGQSPEAWAHTLFDTGDALLLVDGVDELRPERRPKVRKWLADLLTAFPGVHVIVTSRPSAAEPHWLKDFRSLVLEPMTPSDVSAFCRRWHAAIREGDHPADLDDYETALARHLESRRHLRTLASSPLLCALLCALNLDRHKQLPPDRMKLYEASLDLLLERRDAERGVPAAQDIQLDTKAKVTVLQHLAWWLTLNGRAEASVDEAVMQVERAISRMPDVSTDAEPTLRYLLDRSGVIREPVVGRIDFVHRTFQEYLAGKQAAEEHLTDFLVRNAHLDQWRETVVMGAGHAAVPLRNHLLNSLLDRADREQRHARRLRLVAAACLDTAHTIAPEVIDRVDDALQNLVPPRRKNEARSLSLVGDRLLRKLPTSLDGLTPAQASASVRTAAFVGGQEAMRLLSGYASEPHDDVQRELATVWRYFPPEQYAAEVLADAPLRKGFIEVNQIEHAIHLNQLRHLNKVSIDVCDDREVSDLGFLSGIAHLNWFAANISGAVDLRPLAEHRGLMGIDLSPKHGHPVGLDILHRFDSLVVLALPLPNDIRDLDLVRGLPSIKVLQLLSCYGLEDMSALVDMPALQSLLLRWADQLPQIRLPASVANLALYLINELTLTDIVPVLPQLRQLSLYGCPTVADLAPLAESGIAKLDLLDCPVTDLRPLLEMPSLRDLTLHTSQPVDFSPLTDFTKPLRISVTAAQVERIPPLGSNVTVKVLR